MVLGGIKLSIGTPPISSSFKHCGGLQLPHLLHLQQQQSTKEPSLLFQQANRRGTLFSSSSSCFVVYGQAFQRMPLFRRISKDSGLSPRIFYFVFSDARDLLILTCCSEIDTLSTIKMKSGPSRIPTTTSNSLLIKILGFALVSDSHSPVSIDHKFDNNVIHSLYLTDNSQMPWNP